MSRALGRYELVRPLARGGMAEVFLARRRAAGVEKLLVVKRIRPERAGDVRFHELFMREAKLSMSLTHQNIVQTFDFGRAGDQVFLAMERVEGRDLGSCFARDANQPLSPMLAAFIAAECCQALAYAHTRRQDGALLGVVHRDVTLRNVLVSWSGEIKLTDFGIAALAGEDTSKLVGTPAYMAPEQARGEAIDVRADIYGVGMVLRELLTGVRARPGDDREALVAAARQGTLVPWTGDIDAALVAIVDRATSISATDRYPDAGAMHADLDAFVVAERAANRGDSPARQLAAWLVKVWGAERHEHDEMPAAVLEGGAEMMSFLDDAGAIGTGTERSLALTAAEEPMPRILEAAKAAMADADPAPNDARDKTSRAEDARDSRDDASSRDATRDDTALRADPHEPADEQPRRRRGWIAVALVAAIAIVVAIVASKRGSPTGAVVAQASDAAPLANDSITVVTDAEGSAVATDAEPGDGSEAMRPGSGHDGSQGTRQGSDARGSNTRQGSAAQGSNTRQGSGSAIRAGSGSAIRAGSGSAIRAGSGSGSATRVGSGSGSGAGSATVALRKVHINATPWAFFTVDGGPRHQTPKVLELAPGPHQIYFVNDVLKIERTITLVVPADRDMSHVEPLR